ncbi:MAG: hypothetical protein ABEI74_01300 [Candidatus Pacearchaeota archaeon]
MPDKIEPIGSTLKTDKNGFLIKEANKENIKGKWKEAVDHLIDSCKKHLREKNLHSIWIRGSVAKGIAKENLSKEDSSDIDSIILTNCETKEIGKNRLEEISKELSEKFPFIEKVELPVKNYKEILEKEKYKHWRFMLKHLSVCVYGEDISKKFENFKPDKELAKIMSIDLEEIIKKARKKISEHPEKAKRWCKWVMNKIVRQGFLLVLEKEKTFTRDLYPCYNLFSKHYPKKEPEMKEALNLAIYPTNDKEKIYRIFDNLGSFLIEETNRLDLN